jgi:hypothetical protein
LNARADPGIESSILKEGWNLPDYVDAEGASGSRDGGQSPSITPFTTWCAAPI